MLSEKRVKKLLDNMEDTQKLKQIIKLQDDHLNEIAMLTSIHGFAEYHALCDLQTKYREQIDKLLSEGSKVI